MKISKRTGMNYDYLHGGHAPGHLRDALMACIENDSTDPWYGALADGEVLSFYDPVLQGRWHKMTLRERALWLTGQLWNCTDILPGSACEQLDVAPGSTAAAAVRKLRAEIS